MWHSTTTHDLVWECNNHKAGRTKCDCCHLYDTELKHSIELALSHLLERYPDTIADCKERWNTAIGSDSNLVLSALDRFAMQPSVSLFADDATIGTLITSITVTRHHNLVFRFLDGNSFRYRVSDKTPKGRTGGYEKEQNHQKMLAMAEGGCTVSEIAAKLGISKNTVRSYLQRHRSTT